MSHVMCIFFHVFCFVFVLFLSNKNGQYGGASRWRVCYQWGLPRLVYSPLPIKSFYLIIPKTNNSIQGVFIGNFFVNRPGSVKYFKEIDFRTCAAFIPHCDAIIKV